MDSTSEILTLATIIKEYIKDKHLNLKLERDETKDKFYLLQFKDDNYNSYMLTIYEAEACIEQMNCYSRPISSKHINFSHPDSFQLLSRFIDDV